MKNSSFIEVDEIEGSMLFINQITCFSPEAKIACGLLNLYNGFVAFLFYQQFNS